MNNPLFRITISLLLFSSVAARAQDKLGELSPKRIQEIASFLPDKPAGLGQPIQNRDYWTNPKRSAELHRYIGEAEKLVTTPLPAWSDDAYLEYSKVGSRQRGEQMMRGRESVIPALVYAECLENKGRFLPTLNHVLQANANDPTWTWPAHDGSLTSFHGTDYTVDLNASAFGYRLAETVYLLGDKLDPAVRDLILKRLEQRIFEPFRRTVATGKPCYWLGSREKREKNNWNPVCLSGVLGSAFAVIGDKSERAFYAAAAEHYSQYYLNSFTPDGYCTEGGGYWSYGFGHYALMREQLAQATGGKVDLFADPHVVACVLYPLRIRIGPTVVPPFADCRFGVKIDADVLAYCSQALGLKLPMAGYSPFNFAGSLGEVDVTPCAVKPQIASAADDALRFYFKDVGVLACRPSSKGGMGVGIKAGGNFSHSHNDIGSYEIAIGDDEMTGDPGGPLFYDKETFGPHRLDKKLLNSYGHPVPVIGGELQIDAISAKPVVLSTSFGAEHDQFVIDMKPAYAVPSLKALTRTMDYSRSGKGEVVITDEATFTAPTTFEEAMETHGEWKQLDPQTILISFGNSKLLAKISASGEFSVKPETIQELGVTFTRIGLVFKQPCDRAAKVAITFTPQPVLAEQRTAGPMTRQQIIAEGEKMADAQLAKFNEKKKFAIDWVNGVMWAGYADFSHVSSQPDYAAAIERLGEQFEWKPLLNPKNPMNADDLCIAQTFLDAYATRPSPVKIAASQSRFDTVCDAIDQGTNKAGPPGSKQPELIWWWCDALFMAPASMARLSAITHDAKYLRAMDAEWMQTANLLYDNDEHLFYRDSRFLNDKTAHGHKVFWTRGNGWVFAGLARTLRFMPKDFANRARYETIFKEMAAKLASLQQADGTWYPSLLDADEFPYPETSGTALDCFAFAWGINHGLLDRATYLPVVEKAWSALLAARRPDGLLGYVQGVGDRPKPVTADGTQLYATGAFLMTVCELADLAPLTVPAPPKLNVPEAEKAPSPKP